MFNINASWDAQQANKLQRTWAYLPHAMMGVTPYVGMDLYSDNATVWQSSGYPDGAAATTISSSASLGSINAFLNKYVVGGGGPFEGIFDLDTRKYVAAWEKKITFAPFFNKYNRFKNVIAYASMNEPKTLMTTVSSEYLRPAAASGWLIREINATTCIWIYPYNGATLYYKIGTIDTGGLIAWWAGSSVAVAVVNLNSSQSFYDCAVTWTNQLTFIFKSSTANIVYVKAATLSGTVLTFWADLSINTAATDMQCCSITKIAEGKFAAAYRLATGWVYVRVGTISGTTITLWTEVVIGTSAGLCWIYGNGTDAFITIYSLTSLDVRTVAHTVSGTTITTGAFVTNFSVPSGSISQDTGNVSEQVKRIGTNKFLISSPSSFSWSFMNCQVITISGTTITQGSALSYGFANNSPVAYIHEIIADSSYALYRWTYAGFTIDIVSISGTNVSMVKQAQKTIGSSPLVATNFSEYNLGSPTTYVSLMTSQTAGLARVWAFIVWISSPSTTSVLYTVWKVNSTFEFYNDATLIWSAVDFVVPFMRYVFGIDSAVYNQKAYLKIKNTSAESRSLLIENIIMEVD